MKAEERNYVTEIERYFFKLSGKGIMLSARDYGFIRELGRRSVSREMVMKGMDYGFGERERSGAGKPRDLFAIREEIERYIKSRVSEPEPEPPRSQGGTFSEGKMIETVVRNLDRVIMEEDREKIREKYRALRGLVAEAGGEDSANLYRKFGSLWRGFLEDVFSGLSGEERERITAAAENRLPPESKFYDEDAREKTLLAFREEVLTETLGIKNVFTMN